MSLRAARYFIGAAALLFPLQASALDFTPDATPILTDPTYLPLEGQIYGYTAYANATTDGDTLNYLGDKITSFHVSANPIAQMFAYGITDDFTVRVMDTYDPSSTRKVDFISGSSASFNSSGFNDPTFGATYRLLDQAVEPVSLDIYGSYTPDLIGAESASVNEDGTIASGGQSGTLGVALGHETHSFTIRGSFTADPSGDRKDIDLTNGSLFRTDSSTNYTAALATQTRLTDRFAINAAFDYVFQAGEQVTNTTNGIAHDVTGGDVASINVALNYHLIPNTAVLGLTYGYNSYMDAKNTFATATSDSEIRNRDGNSLGVRLDYAFP